MSNWNDLSRDRLIVEYRKYPCLWSHKNEDAKNGEKRRECLNLIMDELNKHEEMPFSQEEVRTQFKNLRDMYRRKRKKLQLQQEINPAVAIDEPGWIYFSRLKFLDDTADIGLPNESPPPPPKKKKTASANRPSDDASLPTPLEENAASIPSASSSSAAIVQQQSSSVSPQPERKSSPREMEGGGQSSSQMHSIKEESIEVVVESSRESPQIEPILEEKNASEQTAKNEQSIPQQIVQQFNSNNNNNSNAKFLQTKPPVIDYSIFHQHHQPLPPTTSTNLERKAADEAPTSGEDEFACFGRFVAMTLKKLSTRSQIGALEARKEISDVLYRAELGSLPR